MSLHNRFWRLARGLGHKVGEDYRARGRRAEERRASKMEEEAAEAAARAEIDELRPIVPSYPATSLPEIRPPADTLGSDLKLPEATAAGTTQAKAPSFGSGPSGGIVDPALVPHYAALGVPTDAGFERVERAYHEAKERCNPESLPADSVEQARARQQEARLDEAFLALKKALVAERRL